MKRKLPLKQERLMRDTVRDASVQFVRLERLLHDAGLHRTAAALNDATKKLGWEAASKL